VYIWHAPEGVENQPHFEELFIEIAKDVTALNQAGGIEVTQVQVETFLWLHQTPLTFSATYPDPENLRSSKMKIMSQKEIFTTFESMVSWLVSLKLLGIFVAPVSDLGSWQILAALAWMLPLLIGTLQIYGMSLRGLHVAATAWQRADQKLSLFERAWYNAFHERLHRWLAPLHLPPALEEYLVFGTDMVTWIFVPVYILVAGDGSHLLNPQATPTYRALWQSA
jgi:hypothetical protein